MPWKLDYDVQVIYKSDYSYKREADYFDGEGFGSFSYGDGKHLDNKVHSKTEYTLITFEMRESGGSIKISNTSAMCADSLAELENMENPKTNESSYSPHM